MQRIAAALVLAVSLTAPLHAQRGGVRFSTRLLYTDANEGAAIADVDRDGRPDIIAGRSWYAAPDFAPRALRVIADWNGYVQSNGDHALDVDGDGWVDVVAGSFNPTEVHWFRNPGKDGLLKGQAWKDSLLVDTKATQNEISFMHDLDGDGTPEWVVDSWNTDAPVYAWKLAKDAAGKPTMQRLTLSERGNRHGMGFGDVNGDGREDVVLGGGWLERPAMDAFTSTWRYHADWEPLEASAPMLVRDLTGDGRADMVVGAGHAYGLWWWEQLAPKPDGTTQWSRHDIDTTFSQVHALAWADLDGDGADELIAGKRKWAHNATGDPGVNDPAVLYYFKWDARTRRFTRYPIAQGTVGTGLQIRTGDLNGDGRVDIVVAGKSGTYLLLNQGK
jgi:hypothetical protein